MAKHRNSLKIEGFLADDPKVQTFQSGKSKCRFTLEVQDEWNGNTTKQYFVVEAWGKSVDEFSRHKTGDHVQLEGAIAQSNYKKKDGTQVNETLIKALRYGWKVWNNNNSGGGQQSRPNNQPNRWESDEEEAF